MKLSTTVLALAVVGLVSPVVAGPIAWGLCQTACNAGYVACCASAGYVAGTFTLGAGVPAALVTCSVVQGTCMATCNPVLLAPCP